MKKSILFIGLFNLFFTLNSNAQWNDGTSTGTPNPAYLKSSTSGSSIIFGANNTNQMLLTSTGLFGIGTAFTPAHLLDVSGGDINVNTSTRGFMVNGNYVLWHNGNITDIFEGVGAGGTTPSGTWNVFNGNDAGYNNTGSANTFSGYDAGYSNTSGTYNTITGWKTGYYNTTGIHNDFYGKRAGFFNSVGKENCYYGSHTAFWGGNVANADSNAFFGFQVGANEQGGENVMMGCFAGSYGSQSIPFNPPYNETNPYNSVWNVFLGSHSAVSTTGNYNVIVGAKADASVGINNAAAIGAEAVSIKSNQFILGNNNQLVGIGLSNDPTTYGPQANLEIATEYNAAAPAGPYPNSNGFLGLGTATAPVNPYLGTGFSGLKFRDLTSFSTVCSPSSSKFGSGNPYPQGVLSVDGFGNVIYVPAPSNGGGTGFGYCTPGPLPSLTGDAGIDLNTNNLYFEGNNSGALGQNDVLIGYPCSTTPPAKLSVLQNSAYTPASTSSIGLYVENDDLQYGSISTPNYVYGIYSYVPDASLNCQSIAGYFDAPGSCPGYNTNLAIIVPPNGGQVGINTLAPGVGSNLDVEGVILNNGNTNINLGSSNGSQALTVAANQSLASIEIAVIGSATNGSSSSSGSYGVFGSAQEVSNTTTTYGVYGSGIGVSGSTNYGVYGYAGGGTTNYAGYFFGDVFVNGPTSGTGYLYASDSIFKNHIDSITNPLAMVEKLKPRTFYFDTNNIYKFNFDNTQQYGFIAQEVQKVVPILVKNVTEPTQYDTAHNIIAPGITFKALNYDEFIPLLTGSIQQQQQTIDSLRTELNSIQACIDSLCGTDGGGRRMVRTNNDNNNQQEVTLSNSALLYQNMPNPFGSGGTKINYFLPENTEGASIVFYDEYGTRLKEVQLTQTGMGTININPSQLSNGVYTYSLVINGNVVDTKKMVFAK